MSEKIHGKIIEALAAVKAVAKDSLNKDQGYKYRSIEQVYSAVKQAFVATGIYLRTEELEILERKEIVSRKGAAGQYVAIKVIYKLTADDGSSITTIGMAEGIDYGDKALAKAMSLAQKNMLINFFVLPTSDDPDANDPDPAAAVQVKHVTKNPVQAQKIRDEIEKISDKLPEDLRQKIIKVALSAGDDVKTLNQILKKSLQRLEEHQYGN